MQPNLLKVVCRESKNSLQQDITEAIAVHLQFDFGYIRAAPAHGHFTLELAIKPPLYLGFWEQPCKF